MKSKNLLYLGFFIYLISAVGLGLSGFTVSGIKAFLFIGLITGTYILGIWGSKYEK